MVEVKNNATVRDRVLQKLQADLFDNQAALRPAQLMAITDELVQLAEPCAVIAQDFGQRLCQQGLALSSLLHAGTALLQTHVENGNCAQVLTISERLAQVVQGYHQAELRRIRAEQQRIQDAVRQAIAEREHETEQLQAMIHELSTPVVPVYRGILVVPLVGAIDSRRSDEITRKVLDSIMQHRASSIIIDITGVPVVDTSVAQHLLHTTQAAALLGADVLLVGINPEIAQTMVQLGINLGNMVTLSDLEQGIAFALRRRGLGILPNT